MWKEQWQYVQKYFNRPWNWFQFRLLSNLQLEYFIHLFIHNIFHWNLKSASVVSKERGTLLGHLQNCLTGQFAGLKS